MAAIFLAAKKIIDKVKLENEYGQTGRSRVCRTSQEGLQSGENKRNVRFRELRQE